jgi:hypothetical protein
MKLQLELTFDSPHFESLDEALIHAIHTSPIALKHLAGELNLLPAGLSKRLNLHPEDNDPRFNLNHFEKYLEVSGDYRPLYYLAEKFLQKDQDRALRDFQAFQKHIPELKQLIAIVENRNKHKG